MKSARDSCCDFIQREEFDLAASASFAVVRVLGSSQRMCTWS